MRTTLDLDDRLLKQAKRRALEQGETLTRFVEGALRARLQAGPATRAPFRFEPVIRSGAAIPGLDFEDRDALYERMEGRS